MDFFESLFDFNGDGKVDWLDTADELAVMQIIASQLENNQKTNAHPESISSFSPQHPLPSPTTAAPTADSSDSDMMFVGGEILFDDDAETLRDAGYDELDLEIMASADRVELMESLGIDTSYYSFDD